MTNTTDNDFRAALSALGATRREEFRRAVCEARDGAVERSDGPMAEVWQQVFIAASEVSDAEAAALRAMRIDLAGGTAELIPDDGTDNLDGTDDDTPDSV